MSSEHDASQLPPLPAYNLSLIETQRQKLEDEAFFEFRGEALGPEAMTRLVANICRTLKVRSADVVRESVRELAGQTMADNNIVRTCWRLAGNVDWLRKGVEVPPWHVQRYEEWVPVQVLAATRERRRNRWYSTYRMRVLAGTSCPLQISKSWVDAFIPILARRLGFSAPWGKHPLKSTVELVNLRFYVLCAPSLSRGSPGFEHVACGPGMIKWNRELIKQRRRIDFQCPEGFAHHCYQCPVGYMDCSAATHRETDWDALGEGPQDGVE